MKKVFLFVFLMAFLINAFAQEKLISGVVTSSSDGSTLPGVNITVKGTTKGTVSDIDGKYSIEVSAGDVLVFSFIGMKIQERTVANDLVINVEMATDALGLDEVVVTGTGSLTKKKQLGNAISTIPAIDIQESGAISVV